MSLRTANCPWISLTAPWGSSRRVNVPRASPCSVSSATGCGVRPSDSIAKPWKEKDAMAAVFGSTVSVVK